MTEPFQLTSPEREAALEKQLYADHIEERRLERRERIATAAASAMLANGFCPASAARQAIEGADALIAALDSKDPP